MNYEDSSKSEKLAPAVSSSSPNRSTIAAKHVLARVLGQWMPFHCLKAKRALLAMLGFLQHAGTTKDPSRISKELLNAVRVRVESAAGLIVARLTVDEKTTVGEVKKRVASLAPQFPASRQQYLVSGCESCGTLADGSVLKDAVATVIVLTTKGRPGDEQAAAAAASAGEAMLSTRQLGRQQQQLQQHQGDEICLLLAVVAIARWSKPRSHHHLEISDNGQRIRTSNRRWIKNEAVGNIRLTQPGHFYTVKIYSRSSVGTRSPRLAVSIICENAVPQSWLGFYNYVALRAAAVSIWCDCDQDEQGVSVGHTDTMLFIDRWKEDDEITVRLGKSKDGSGLLTVAFEVNSECVHEVQDSKHQPPFLAVCELPKDYCLDIVEGVGEPLEE